MLAEGRDRDCGGLGAEDARGERHRDEAVRARRGDFVLGEAAFGADEHDDGVRRGRERRQGSFALAFPCHHAQPGPWLRNERVEQRRRIDPWPGRASRLLRGGERDPAPPLEPDALRDGMTAEHRRDPTDAELRRLLDDEIHLRALQEPGRERQIEPGLARRTMCREDHALGGAPAHALDPDLVLGADVVEDEEPLARPEPQRAEVAQLRAGDPDAKAVDLRARNVEPMHYTARASVSVAQSSSARVSVTVQPGYARRTSGTCAARMPDTTSRPPPDTAASSDGASAAIASASRFATTRSNRQRTAPIDPARTETRAAAFATRLARAIGSTETSVSSATTRCTPRRASASARMPEPVPTSSADRTVVSASTRSIASRQPRVVACPPVPKAIPGSM